MNCSKFTRQFWRQYIMLEKEFASTEQFVTLHPDNSNTFSSAYSKLLLQIGSEVDIVAKVLCQIHEPTFSGDNINQYMTKLLSVYPDFEIIQVEVINTGIIVEPWKDWSIKSPSWWTVYNKVKHDRTKTGSVDSVQKEYYKFANQNYTLSALSGLFQLLIYSYYQLSVQEGKRIPVPLPGSRILKLNGSHWSDMQFIGDDRFYLDNGHQILETPDFPY